MLNINSGAIIGDSIKGNDGQEKMLVLFANKTGLIFEVDSISNAAFRDPDKFIKDKDLKPIFRLDWSDKENKGRGGAVVATVDDTTVINSTLNKKRVKAQSMLNKNISKLYDLFTFFPENDLQLIAKNALVQVYGMTTIEACNACNAYLTQLESESSLAIAKTFTDSYELQTAVLKAKTLPATPAKVRKPRKAKQLKSAEVIEAVATKVVKEETQIPAKV